MNPLLSKLFIHWKCFNIELKFENFYKQDMPGEWQRADRLRAASLSHGGWETSAASGHRNHEGGTF